MHAGICSTCLTPDILVHLVDMLWSNSETFDTGGNQGIVHGFWGHDVDSVNATVTNPSWTAMRLQLRHWAIDSWDSGERACVLVDDVEVWSLSRGACSCSPFASYFGDSNISDPQSGESAGEPDDCYFDVDVVVGLAGRSSFVLTLGSTIGSAASDKSWGFGRVSMAHAGL